jgi:hypothetical protein
MSQALIVQTNIQSLTDFCRKVYSYHNLYISFLFSEPESEIKYFQEFSQLKMYLQSPAFMSETRTQFAICDTTDTNVNIILTEASTKFSIAPEYRKLLDSREIIRMIIYFETTEKIFTHFHIPDSKTETKASELIREFSLDK